jgi:predicted HicB family RNase H-like nuclease
MKETEVVEVEETLTIRIDKETDARAEIQAAVHRMTKRAYTMEACTRLIERLENGETIKFDGKFAHEGTQTVTVRVPASFRTTVTIARAKAGVTLKQFIPTAWREYEAHR